MRTSHNAALAFAAIVAITSTASTAPLLVAVVESLDGNVGGVEIMDYVEAGQIIRLGARDQIILGYLSSCVRETIIGGTVIVGKDKSEVQSGQVQRILIRCDTGRVAPDGNFVQEIAGRAFRGPTLSSAAQPAENAPMTIYGASPVLELKAPGLLTIERIDQAERHTLRIEQEHLLRSMFYDFARSGRALTPGGTYRATMDTKQIVFRIDANAKPGQGPIVSRLLRFAPPN